MFVLTAGSTVVQGLSLRVTMQLLFILITLISVHATPEEDADVRDTTPYGADAQTLLAMVGAPATPWLLQSRSSWYVTENNMSSF